MQFRDRVYLVEEINASVIYKPPSLEIESMGKSKVEVPEDFCNLMCCGNMVYAMVKYWIVIYWYFN